MLASAPGARLRHGPRPGSGGNNQERTRKNAEQVWRRDLWYLLACSRKLPQCSTGVALFPGGWAIIRLLISCCPPYWRKSIASQGRNPDGEIADDRISPGGIKGEAKISFSFPLVHNTRRTKWQYITKTLDVWLKMSSQNKAKTSNTG
jgi:hypothetical protein